MNNAKIDPKGDYQTAPEVTLNEQLTHKHCLLANVGGVIAATTIATTLIGAGRSPSIIAAPMIAFLFGTVIEGIVPYLTSLSFFIRDIRRYGVEVVLESVQPRRRDHYLAGISLFAKIGPDDITVVIFFLRIIAVIAFATGCAAGLILLTGL